MFKKFILLSAIALSLTACLGGGSSEPTKYYTIAVEKISTPVTDSYKDKRLQVRKFTIEPAYQRVNIVYRESAYDFMFYDLDLWASRPEHMIAQITGEYMTKSGLFKSVETKASGKPDYELMGHITAIEEIDEENAQYAHLALQLTLKAPDSDTPIWQASYDERKSMDDREPRTTAESLSRLLASIMENFLSEIASKLN